MRNTRFSPALAKISYHFASTIFHSATRSALPLSSRRTMKGAVSRFIPRIAPSTSAALRGATPRFGRLVPVRKSNKPISSPFS